jgi:hypothetical protein
MEELLEIKDRLLQGDITGTLILWLTTGRTGSSFNPRYP